MKKLSLLVMPLMAASFLVGCNNGGEQDPVVYYTIKFNGTDCYMIDDIGGQVSEKQFEVGQTASYHLVGKTEEYEIPLENHVDVTYTKTGEPFDGTYTYNEEDGSILVTMTDDVTVTARSEKMNYTVTKEEFEKAISFEGVEYLQADRTISSFHVYAKQYSPNICYYFFGVPDAFAEGYSYKVSDTLFKEISRTDDEAEWGEWEDSSRCPSVADEDVNGIVVEYEIEFDSEKYDPTTKSYVFPTNMEGVNFTFKFINKKLVYLDAVTMLLTFAYEEKTPELPIDPPTIRPSFGI